MLAYRSQRWRCFFTSKAALLCVILLIVFFILALFKQRACLFRNQARLQEAKDKLAEIQKNLSSFKSYKSSLEKQKVAYSKWTESIRLLENNLSAYLDPFLLSKNSAIFLQKIRHYPDRYNSFGKNIQKGLCFLLALLRNENKEYARIENIGIFKNYADESLIASIKYIFGTENLENWFCKIKFQTTPKNFNNFLSSVANAKLPIWIQDINIEASAPEFGALPTFTILLQWCNPQLL